MRILLLAILLLVPATSSMAQQRLVAPLPADNTLTIQRDLTYAQLGDTALKLDVYRARTQRRGVRAPVFVIYNGFEMAGLKAAPQQTGWAKLAAAAGFTAVTYDSHRGGSAGDLDRVLDYVRANRARLNADPERVVFLAWSGHVTSGVGVAMDPARTSLRAAIFLYGIGDAPRFRHDLPTLFVRAGLDAPRFNRDIGDGIERALGANAPVTVINYSAGVHGFDLDNDNEASRAVIAQVLDFARTNVRDDVHSAVLAGIANARAAAALMQEDWTTAVREYTQLVQQNARDENLQLRLGEALLGAGDNARALEHLSLAWEASRKTRTRDIGYPAAVAAARMGDFERAEPWLTLLRVRGYTGASFRNDTSLRALHSMPLFQKYVAHVRATVPDSTFWAEGVDYDARTGSYYVASIRHGTIAEIGPQGRVRELLPRGSAKVSAMFGVRIDTARNVLWATTSALPAAEGYTLADSSVAALLRIRLSDGMIERRWDLPLVPRGHILGDLAIAPSGDLFVTDSRQPLLLRLRADADTLEEVRNPLFRSLQGVAPTADGSAVYLADYSNGLLRYDVESGAVERVTDASGASARGCDGIVWHNGAIIAVQNGASPARIIRIELDAAGRRIVGVSKLLEDAELADEPTIGTIANGEFVFVANSQWEKLTDAGVPKPGVHRRSVWLMGVPLR